ncbi:hypothetical protein BDP27DRAFT_1429416 [Rhodocollybia butyracea]|uniref:Secreted protein n=1 Tax=Rhodocollybia butyracea TaxID=206335 RepID=A0A9P5U035_9AGAR|nr:hypothetical protein BDP27DRAFT_1429416 [Rhodocollybia butyracea]
MTLDLRLRLFFLFALVASGFAAPHNAPRGSSSINVPSNNNHARGISSIKPIPPLEVKIGKFKGMGNDYGAYQEFFVDGEYNGESNLLLQISTPSGQQRERFDKTVESLRKAGRYVASGMVVPPGKAKVPMPAVIVKPREKPTEKPTEKRALGTGTERAARGLESRGDSMDKRTPGVGGFPLTL